MHDVVPRGRNRRRRLRRKPALAESEKTRRRKAQAWRSRTRRLAWSRPAWRSRRTSPKPLPRAEASEAPSPDTFTLGGPESPSHDQRLRRASPDRTTRRTCRLPSIAPTRIRSAVTIRGIDDELCFQPREPKRPVQAPPPAVEEESFQPTDPERQIRRTKSEILYARARGDATISSLPSSRGSHRRAGAFRGRSRRQQMSP